VAETPAAAEHPVIGSCLGGASFSLQRWRQPASAILLALLLCASAFALDITKLKRTAHVNDFARVIDSPSAQSLEAYCAVLETSTGAQVAIVTVETLGGDDIADVANRLFRQWSLGTKPQDNGLLLLFAVKDNKDRAEIGYGLEPAITDAEAGSILRGIRPILRQGSYGPALLAAVQQFGAKIGHAPAAGIAGRRPARYIPYWIVAVGLFLLLSLIFWIANGRRGGFKGIFTALFDNMGGRRTAWVGGGPSHYSEGGGVGGFGGKDSGGGGFGGFGGGDSGGGGASSDW
jgi:uncharacterized protein